MVCTKVNTNRECSFFGVGWWGLWALWNGFCGMEMNKKSGGGDVRASPFRGTASGIKPKTSFQLNLHSRPRLHAVRATHIPRRPKKKPLRGKKVGFAEKKLRLTNSWWGQLKFCNSVTKVTAIVVALLVSWCVITSPP